MIEATQADMPPTADEIEQVAALFEALHNKPAAWAVRKAGLCGTVHHAALEFLRNHRQAAYAAGKADGAKAGAMMLDALRGAELALPFMRDLLVKIKLTMAVETCDKMLAQIRAAIAAAGGE